MTFLNWLADRQHQFAYAVMATVNFLVINGALDWSKDTISAFNIALIGWLGVLFVPKVVAKEQAAIARSSGYGHGMADTVAAVNALPSKPVEVEVVNEPVLVTETPAPKPAKKAAKRR